MRNTTAHAEHDASGQRPDAAGGRSQTDEWVVLAGMRFFLACVVMMSHLDIASMVDTDWTKKLGPDAAVLGFFMISGYSIAAARRKGKDGGTASIVIGYSRGNEPKARETASDDHEECKR